MKDRKDQQEKQVPADLQAKPERKDNKVKQVKMVRLVDMVLKAQLEK